MIKNAFSGWKYTKKDCVRQGAIIKNGGVHGNRTELANLNYLDINILEMVG